MNLSLDSFHKRILNPVWSVDHSRDSAMSANNWPLRPQSHPRRFYSCPKTRRNYVNVTQFSPQITPITMRVEIEQFNKQKSQTSMAFCSTSKVKYMPLHKVSPSDISSAKWCSNNSSMFPMLARPSSRPVILHGQRYTIMAIDDERSSTGVSSNNKEDEKLSPKIDNVSEQRRRFNEVERNKSNTKTYRGSTESSEFRIMRNYCLSGHRMFIKSSRDTGDDRISRGKISTNLKNVIKKEDEIIIENTEEDNNVEQLQQDIQISTDKSNDPVISVDFVSSTKEDGKSVIVRSIVSGVVKSVIESLKIAKTNTEKIGQAKHFLTEMIHGFSESIIDDSNIKTIDHTWDSLNPTIMIREEDESQDLSLFDKSSTMDAEVFLERMFGEDKDATVMNFWSKIFSSLRIQTVDVSLFVNFANFVRTFQNERLDEVLFDKLTLAKIDYWIQLFVKLLSVDDENQPDLSHYLTMMTAILLSGDEASKETEVLVEQSLEEFLLNGAFIADDDASLVTVPLVHLVDTIPWIFRTHNDLFHHSPTIDNFTIALASLTSHRVV